MSQAATSSPTGTAPPPAEVLAELLAVREQLGRLETSPLVTGAHRLARSFGPVLEPVWSLLAGTDDGVGHLRQYGTGTVATSARRANTAVATKAVRAYKKLKLVGPDRHQIWAALANPAETLLTAAAIPSPISAPGTRTAVLTAVVRPSLPAALHRDDTAEHQLVPALRAVLRRWCDLAHRSGGTTGDHARIMLAAAHLARGAALDGDTDTVGWFVERWLGLNPLDTRIDGTTAALLENDWTRNRVDTRLSQVLDTVTGLRTDADRHHRTHRPVWETQIKGYSITLLSDQTYDSPTTEADDPASKFLSNEQFDSVFNILTPTEQPLIQLLYVMELTVRETADVLGVSMLAVGHRLDRCLERLRRLDRNTILRDYL